MSPTRTALVVIAWSLFAFALVALIRVIVKIVRRDA
jgi:hypothetical protein